MTTDPFLDDSPSFKRDRFGRYLLPDPDTGKERAWTRVTTFADTLDDRYNLERWKIRQALVGAAQRPDLIMSIASAKADDKATLDKLADEAMAAAASAKGANLGTALHRFTEAVDRGESPVVPAPYDRDIDAYRATMAASGFTVAPGMIERVVCLPDLGLCGTFDRLLVTETIDPCKVGDVKTGQGVAYGMGGIAIQLALYAHAPLYWTGDGWADLLPRDTDEAVIIHLPAGEARCELLAVNIAAGWEAVERAAWVRSWRKRRDLHRTIAPSLAVEPPVGAGEVAAELPPGVDDPRPRMATLSDTQRAHLKARWPFTVPASQLTADQWPQLADLLDDVTDAPFDPPPATPSTPATVRTSPPSWTPPDDGGEVDPATVELIQAKARALPAERRAWMAATAADARAAGRATTPGTVRWFEVARAMMVASAVTSDDDHYIRHWLAAAIDSDGPLMPTISVGAVFGSLTIDEARKVADLCERAAAGAAALDFGTGRPRAVAA